MAAVEALLRLACALFVRLVGVWPVRVAIAPARASCELAGKRAGGVCGECAGRPFTIDVGSGDFAEAEHDETREEPDEVDAEEDAEAVAVEAAAAAAPVGTGRVGLLSATGEVVIGGGGGMSIEGHGTSGGTELGNSIGGACSSCGVGGGAQSGGGGGRRPSGSWVRERVVSHACRRACVAVGRSDGSCSKSAEMNSRGRGEPAHASPSKLALELSASAVEPNGKLPLTST